MHPSEYISDWVLICSSSAYSGAIDLGDQVDEGQANKEAGDVPM